MFFVLFRALQESLPFIAHGLAAGGGALRFETMVNYGHMQDHASTWTWIQEARSGWFGIRWNLSSHLHSLGQGRCDLVGGWTTPDEKYDSCWIIIPCWNNGKGESKPPMKYIVYKTLYIHVWQWNTIFRYSLDGMGKTPQKMEQGCSQCDLTPQFVPFVKSTIADQTPICWASCFLWKSSYATQNKTSRASTTMFTVLLLRKVMCTALKVHASHW